MALVEAHPKRKAVPDAANAHDLEANRRGGGTTAAVLGSEVPLKTTAVFREIGALRETETILARG